MKNKDILIAFRIARKEIKGKKLASHDISAILLRSKELAVRKTKINEILNFL